MPSLCAKRIVATRPIPNFMINLRSTIRDGCDVNVDFQGEHGDPSTKERVSVIFQYALKTKPVVCRP